MDPNHRRNQLLSIGGTALLAALLYAANSAGSDYTIRILNNCAIFIILAVSYNLINGATGPFSLEPNAFVAIGAYTSALRTLTPMEKEISFIIEPCIWPLSVISVPFAVSLLAAGIVTAFFGFLMGFPVFRVRGDYTSASIFLAAALFYRKNRTSPQVIRKYYGRRRNPAYVPVRST